MVFIDGSTGEGGGQILRTALSLSLVTGKPFRIEKIRSRRKRPGLLHQHLTAVQAAREIGRAEVKGDRLSATEITFIPREASPGIYHFDIGSAGSTTLVLETVLPSLLLSPRPSTVILEGGTHNPLAPPFEFIEKSFFPLLNRMGPQVEAKLERAGFYPRGGGRIRVTVKPTKKLQGVDLVERGPIRRRHARALITGLPRSIAERELGVIQKLLGWRDAELEIREIAESYGPGNVVLLEIDCDSVTEIFAAFGQRGVRAEEVAEKVAKEAKDYLDHEVAVGPYLADQLLVPLALAGEGSFKTLALSLHAATNINILKRFLDVEIQSQPVGEGAWLVKIQKMKTKKQTEKTTFAAGCFWHVEEAFRNLNGVSQTQVGYAGGSFKNPTYEDVCRGATGHAEAVEIEFDSSVISYEKLLEVFWACHDPTTLNRQGPDVGEQYRSAIFFHRPEQEASARKSKEALERSGQWKDPVVTEITPASTFWRAEEYHQQYLAKRGLGKCGGNP